MENWDVIKNKLADQQFDSLEKSYNAEMELARNKDKASEVIYQRVSEDYNRYMVTTTFVGQGDNKK
jgi:hypothetical protein